jgi:DNA-binding MarR family transcriptional regulator
MPSRPKRVPDEVAPPSATPPPARPDLTRALSYRVAVLSRHLAREAGRLYLDRIGLTLPQWRVLSTLGLFGESGVSQIADHCAMDRGQTSRTIDTLMQAGLVHLRPDARDGRVTWCSLSPEGERRYEAGLPIAFQRQERLLQDFTPQERELFSRMLDRMIGRFAGKRP